jgi:hypothetical protein
MPTNYFQSSKGSFHLHPDKVYSGGSINLTHPIDNNINSMPSGTAGISKMGISPFINVSAVNPNWPQIHYGGALHHGLKHLNFQTKSKDNRNIKFRIK